VNVRDAALRQERGDVLRRHTTAGENFNPSSGAIHQSAQLCGTVKRCWGTAGGQHDRDTEVDQRVECRILVGYLIKCTMEPDNHRS
jgi:hypothetical protein